MPILVNLCMYTHVALTSFCPTIPGKESTSICVKIIVDCSGSMNGDSINQAKIGLLRILDNLRETDTFNIVRFGSTARAYFPECVPAKGRALQNARKAVESMEADLGGTEIGDALDLAFQLKSNNESAGCMLLITDGEIYQHEQVIEQAIALNHRIFSLGVGSAVQEHFVRGIAEKTGGACELVAPNEGMANAIYRQFKRMYQPRAISATIEWSGMPQWQTPHKIGAIYSGDTLHVFTGFNQEIHGDAKLVMTLDDGRQLTQQLKLHHEKTGKFSLARIAADRRVSLMSGEVAATALAVKYQLISRYTNYLIVETREEKVNELPILAKVPQMQAAGWGGAGAMLGMPVSSSSTPAFLRKQLH